MAKCLFLLALAAARLASAQIEFFTPPAHPPVPDLRYPAALRSDSIDARGVPNLFNRQLDEICTPKYPKPCDSGNHCCGETQRCCHYPYCCNDMANCVQEDNSCCPLEAETCNDPVNFCAKKGSICCGDTVCPSDGVCHVLDDGRGLCCFEGETACGSFCCPPGSRCSATRSGVCERIMTTTTRRTSTRTSEGPFISSPTPSDPRDIDGKDDDPEETGGGGGAAVPTPTQGCDLTSAKRLKRRDARGAWVPLTPAEENAVRRRQFKEGGDEIGAFCDVDGDEVPVVRIERNDQNGALIDSICAGIESLGGNLGGDVALTWAGDDKKAGSRKRASGCLGHCNDVRIDGGVSSCHQFPFASVLEGAIGRYKECIPAAQNTLQGAYLSAWAAYYEFKDKQVFVLSAECDAGSSKVKRQVDSNGGGNGGRDPALRYEITGKGQSDVWVEGVGQDEKRRRGYLVLPIGDVNIGSYDVEVKVDGEASAVKVLNSAGENVGSSKVQSLDQKDASDGDDESALVDDAQTISFELSEDDYGLGIVVYAKSKNVKAELEWTGVVMDGGNLSEDRDSSAARIGMPIGLGVGIAGLAAWAGL